MKDIGKLLIGIYSLSHVVAFGKMGKENFRVRKSEIPHSNYSLH